MSSATDDCYILHFQRNLDDLPVTFGKIIFSTITGTNFTSGSSINDSSVSFSFQPYFMVIAYQFMRSKSSQFSSNGFQVIKFRRIIGPNTLGRHKLKYVSLYELKSFFRHSSHRFNINEIWLNSSVTSSNRTLTSDEICSVKNFRINFWYNR